MEFNLESVGDHVTRMIKQQTWFPYRTGKLKFEATSGRMLDATTYCIHFDSSVAPYVTYLEEGTDPHDIPRAFGRPLPFGIGGRFNGRFHPGSRKHVGFISEKSVGAIVDYIVKIYGGIVERV